jgi:hypothetical protein
MKAALDNPTLMKVGLHQSPYYDERNWQTFLNCRDDLRIIFNFLESIDFPAYWQDTIRLQVESSIQTIAAYLANYDVVSQLEKIIDYTMSSPAVHVYVLHYTRPHGIKVIGQRFLTAASWPAKIALRTVVHEMLRPPYDLKTDQLLRQAIEGLQQDPFVSEKFSSHNADFGYNSFEGYIEENCVRALDQLVNETFRIAINPQDRWRNEDGGMHIFAAALYHTLKTQHFTRGFRDFLLDALQTHLVPGKVQAAYDNFYAS